MATWSIAGSQKKGTIMKMKMNNNEKE